MEYATNVTGPTCDYNKMRFVGYTESNDCIKELYAPENIKLVSKQITKLLMGVDPHNRPIIVPDQSICNMISECYDSFRPPTGDIYGRYNIPGSQSNAGFQSIINQAIELITSQVRNTLEIEENNAKLTAWTTVYGDFNEHKLRQHAPIKVRVKRPAPMQFNMNY